MGVPNLLGVGALVKDPIVVCHMSRRFLWLLSFFSGGEPGW